MVNVHELLDVGKNLERMQVGLNLVDDGPPTRLEWWKPVEKTEKACQEHSLLWSLLSRTSDEP